MSCCARCFGEVQELAVFCPNCSQPHEPAFDKLLNRVIGDRYQIYRRLEKGGLSTVFTAIDLPTDEIVVVKVSDPGHLTKRELTYALDGTTARHYWAEMLERMRREAETLTQLRHPNIVQLYDTGTITEELRYVVMEYLRGHTLRDELEARRRLPLDEALAIAIALADALREIHSRVIVHRDLNPRNVMLCAEEAYAAQTVIKLIDFGIAKFPQPHGAPPFTQHSVLSGTVAYASPEQCQNQPLDQRSDLYSLGVVLYEMVTGERPFTGRTPTEIALKQIQAQPKAPRDIVPELPLSLEAMILRALAKDPADRQQNVVELAEELRGIIERVVIQLPEKQTDSAVTLATLPINPLAFAEFDSPVVPMEEQALFTSDTPSSTPRGRKLAYVAALALLLTGAIFFAQNHRGNRGRVPVTNEVAVALPSPSATTTPALAIEVSPTPNASPTPEPLAPAPEAEMAQAVFAPHNHWPVYKATKSVRQARSARTIPVIAQPAALNQAAMPPSPTYNLPVFNQPDRALPPISAQPDVVAAPYPPDNTPSSSASIDPAESSANQAESIAQHRRPRVTQRSNNEYRLPDRQTAQIEQPYNSSAAPHDFSPKVIAWNGTVRGERLLRLEMPGVPGTVEVLRSYRNRVGIVEPPGTENRWRLVVLRIFGSGEVTIRVRWWPSSRRSD